MTEKLLLTIPEAAARLSLGKTVVYELLARGELPTVRIGRSRRVRTDDLEAYVGRLERESGPSRPSEVA